jgi:diadenosine tetraphosphatase ApaH/serine/threonine PP2A family protein phosphatase
MIVNSGSVGQPRDGNPDSCFVIFDSEKNSYEFIREKYDVKAVYKKIIKAGLNEFLGERLLLGK